MVSVEKKEHFVLVLVVVLAVKKRQFVRKLGVLSVAKKRQFVLVLVVVSVIKQGQFPLVLLGTKAQKFSAETLLCSSYSSLIWALSAELLHILDMMAMSILSIDPYDEPMDILM